MTDQEINEAVARKLGWKPSDGTSIGPIGTWRKSGKYKVLPDYCHSIEAAWEIIPKFRKWTLSAIDSKDVCFSWIDAYGDLQAVRADTASRAICEAFLRLEEK